MKTTLNIDDALLKRLRQMSGETGRTISELVETAVHRYLLEPIPEQELPPLPTFDGGARVNVADRNALCRK